MEAHREVTLEAATADEPLVKEEENEDQEDEQEAEGEDVPEEEEFEDDDYLQVTA